MKFNEIDWADSQIERIAIEFDHAILFVFNDTYKKLMEVHCTGLIGIDNLCIWDDTFIMEYDLTAVSNDNDYLKQVFEHYDKDFDYGGRSLSDGILELKIELSNNITFSVYCLNVEVNYAES